LRLLDERGKKLKLTVCANCADYIFPIRPSKTIALRPGESAHILVGVTMGDIPGLVCQNLSRIDLMLGGSTNPPGFKFEVQTPVCGNIDVSAWRAGAYKDEELLPLDYLSSLCPNRAVQFERTFADKGDS
jgi:hypothetical protein